MDKTKRRQERSEDRRSTFQTLNLLLFICCRGAITRDDTSNTLQDERIRDHVSAEAGLEADQLWSGREEADRVLNEMSYQKKPRRSRQLVCDTENTSSFGKQLRRQLRKQAEPLVIVAALTVNVMWMAELPYMKYSFKHRVTVGGAHVSLMMLDCVPLGPFLKVLVVLDLMGG